VYGSPNNVGLFLGRCIPFALTFVLVQLDSTRRVLALVALAIMLIAVLLTQSAGALFLGVPAALVVVLALAWGKRGVVAAIGLALLGTVATALALRSPRFARLLDFSEGTNFYRIRVWESALHAIQDRPVTGLGLDQFLYAFRGQYILPDAWQEPNLSHPHNFLLDLWVRLGVLGVAVFVWWQVAFWRAISHVYRTYRNGDALMYAISIGAMGSMANLLAHGLVDNSVYVNDLAYVFVLLLGIAASLGLGR
jgi:O-antigen ligase